MSTENVITKNPLVKFCIGMLPSNMKRIMYLASLAAIVKETTVPEKALIAKLNDVLKLSTVDENSLKLPIYLSKLIWQSNGVFKVEIDTLKNCEGDDEQAIVSANRIAESTPPWFIYDSPKIMSRDLIALFTKENKIFRPGFVNTQGAF